MVGGDGNVFKNSLHLIYHCRLVTVAQKCASEIVGKCLVKAGIISAALFYPEFTVLLFRIHPRSECQAECKTKDFLLVSLNSYNNNKSTKASNTAAMDPLI